MNLYSVTIKNRLGKKFGQNKLNIIKNEEDGMQYSILPGQDVQVSKHNDRFLLWSIKLEISPMDCQTEIPIKIQSSGNYRVTIFQENPQGKWTLEFEAPENVTTGALYNDPSVNITIGQEEATSLVKARNFFRKKKLTL